MPWLKVDDKLHSHKKAARAGVCAMGLWVLCGSWAMDQLTDGFIPDYIARRIDPDADKHAERLVSAGLWIAGEHDGDQGWWFHDWAVHQPTRESVESKREYERDKKRDQRRNAKGQYEESPRESRGDNAGTSAGVPKGVQPSRPDPTRTSKDVSRAKREGTRIPDGFAVDASMREWAAKEAPYADVDRATANFVDYWTSATKNATKLDWARTWQNWLRRDSDDTPTWKRQQQQPEPRTRSIVSERDMRPFTGDPDNAQEWSEWQRSERQRIWRERGEIA